jgi:hypothetical protein
LKPRTKATTTAPAKKKVRTCSVEVEEVEDENSSRDTAATNAAISPTSSIQIPNFRKVSYLSYNTIHSSIQSGA